MKNQSGEDRSAEEQRQMLRESAAEFVRRSTDTKKFRERREQLPGFDAKHLKQMVEMGWFGMLVPEAHGGMGPGLSEVAVVLQELGKGLLAEPLVASCVLAGRMIERSDHESLKSKLFAGLVDATSLPSLAWQEAQPSLNPLSILTRAFATDTGLHLQGTKRLVAGAAAASGFVVSALDDNEQLGLYWIPKDSEGLSLTYEWRADGSPVGLLQLNRINVSQTQVLIPHGIRALEAINRTIDEAAVMVGSEMLGVMETALSMTLAYMRTRVQFGKPIGSFQVLQHKAADLYVQQELTRAVLDEVVRALDEDTFENGEERSLLASRCKSRCSDAGLRVTREAIQLHGAIGFTDEYDVGLYLKRALVLSAWLGNASAHRQRFAALMQYDLTS